MEPAPGVPVAKPTATPASGVKPGAVPVPAPRPGAVQTKAVNPTAVPKTAAPATVDVAGVSWHTDYATAVAEAAATLAGCALMAAPEVWP